MLQKPLMLDHPNSRLLQGMLSPCWGLLQLQLLLSGLLRLLLLSTLCIATSIALTAISLLATITIRTFTTLVRRVLSSLLVLPATRFQVLWSCGQTRFS